MVAPNVSRGSISAVLVPFQWVTLFQLEDPYADPAYDFHHVNACLQADTINMANATIEMHESENGINWRRCNEGRHGVIVPGGVREVEGYHVLRWVRIVLYSTGSGIVHTVKLTPEPQVLPGFIQSPLAIELAGDPTVTVGFGGRVDPQSPCNFEYQFEASLDWERLLWCFPQPTADAEGRAQTVGGDWFREDGALCRWFYPDLDLYVRDVNAGGVTYFNNLAGADLSLNRDAFPGCAIVPVPPEVITGTYTEGNTFYVWYSQRDFCSPEAENVIRRITITNTGTCRVLVNNNFLLPGEVFTLNDYLYAGYATGDMSAWLGGTPVTV